MDSITKLGNYNVTFIFLVRKLDKSGFMGFFYANDGHILTHLTSGIQYS